MTLEFVPMKFIKGFELREGGKLVALVYSMHDSERVMALIQAGARALETAAPPPEAAPPDNTPVRPA